MSNNGVSMKDCTLFISHPGRLARLRARREKPASNRQNHHLRLVAPTQQKPAFSPETAARVHAHLIAEATNKGRSALAGEASRSKAGRRAAGRALLLAVAAAVVTYGIWYLSLYQRIVE